MCSGRFTLPGAADEYDDVTTLGYLLKTTLTLQGVLSGPVEGRIGGLIEAECEVS